MSDLIPTAGQTVGPFFGYALPYPGGNQLVPPTHPAAIRLRGTVFDGDGHPIPDALLEIRQPGPDGVVPTVAGSLRRTGADFTGWGRASTDSAGEYSFFTLEPGPARPGAAPFFAVTVFARGLLDRLFTRAYLPGHADAQQRDALLAGLAPSRRATLIAGRTGNDLRFDVHLQGEHETVFLDFGSPEAAP